MLNLSRNIVIEASAGTGKTYTLVRAILTVLFHKNVPMDALVALTFTKKAAGEMKERIADELQRIVAATMLDESWKEWGLSLSVLQEQAHTALEKIDLASIGTIHSFAFSLLKRFPFAAGIGPEAEVDDKEIRTDDLFEAEWSRWIAQELRAAGPKEWLYALETLSLADIKQLARRLADFDIPLSALPLSEEDLGAELEPLYTRVRELIAGKPDVKSTFIARACEEVLGAARAKKNVADLSPETRETLTLTPDKTKDWTSDQVADLKAIRLVALNLLAEGDKRLSVLTTLLKPFIQQFRETLLAEGILSNNALLVLARNMLHKDLAVRHTLKQQIRAIFIDEFQDTDPIQGELLLFLSENVSSQAKDAAQVRLENGKLFIVGDPKQSIYLFRGADIGTYGRITQKVLDQGGKRVLLEESYRSHEHIVHAVNAAFSRMITHEEPVSPPYNALVPRRRSEHPEKHLVELRLAHSLEPCKSAESLAKEAQDAASWIASNVRRATFDVGPRTSDGLKYKDIALIFQSSPAMTPFIDELRRMNIPFVVGRERYFYRTQEVTDALNLLRVVADPTNRLALAGFLRSAFGGFTDLELAQLQAANGLRLDKPLPKELSGPAHRSAWELLRRLHQRSQNEPLRQVLDHVYEETFILELAARSYHRDQTLANLQKLRRLLESFGEDGETTLVGLLDKIDRFMELDRLEGESPLADESYDAVRLMTIHAAKGLEFPVVWLPGLHRDAGGNADAAQISARFDWDKKRLGIRMGTRARNIGDFVLEKDLLHREEAESARVLYVAMTRARDHLILSGGVCRAGRSKQPAPGSFLARLASSWNLDLETVPEGDLKLGEGVMTIRRSPRESIQPVAPGETRWIEQLDPSALALTWKKREAFYTEGMATPLVLTPTRNAEGEKGRKGDGEKRQRSHTFDSKALGTLVHRFLERWDFQTAKCSMPAQLREAANTPELKNVVDEAQRLLADFIGSEQEEEIKTSKILARELPFIYTTEDGRLMRGTMDVVYRLPNNQLVIGDYKTDKDRVDDRYTAQGAAYQEAVQKALGEKPLFKVIYVREPSGELTKA